MLLELTKASTRITKNIRNLLLHLPHPTRKGERLCKTANNRVPHKKNAPTFPPPITPPTKNSEPAPLPSESAIRATCFRIPPFRLLLLGFRQKSLVPFLASPGHGREQGYPTVSIHRFPSLFRASTDLLVVEAEADAGGVSARGFASCCGGGK